MVAVLVSLLMGLRGAAPELRKWWAPLPSLTGRRAGRSWRPVLACPPGASAAPACRAHGGTDGAVAAAKSGRSGPAPHCRAVAAPPPAVRTCGGGGRGSVGRH